MGSSARPEVMAEIRAAAQGRGLEVVPDADVEAFLAAERVRYLDSLTPAQVERLLATTGAGTVLTGSILALEDPVGGSGPVSVALHATLLGRDGAPLWQNVVAMTGGDTENALGLGAIRELRPLLRRAARRLLEPMPVPAVRVRVARALGRGGLPRVYRSAEFLKTEQTICVLPLEDHTAARRRGAAGARTMTALLQRRLSERAKLRVVTPAELRHALVAARLPSPAGMGPEELKKLGAVLGVRHFLSGTVMAYDASATTEGVGADVEVHLSLVDNDAGRVIWSGVHRRSATEFRGLFGRNSVTSVAALADRVVTELVEAFLRP